MSARPLARVVSPTEQRNPRTSNLDQLPTLDLLAIMNAEDRIPPAAVARVLPLLAQVVDVTAERLSSGGRLHYFGAGTSGRIAVMDAAELVPTFGLTSTVVVAHHAGGSAALELPVEDAEDDEDEGAREAVAVTASDVVVGLSASGRTPYIRGAMRAARAIGAYTVLVSANPDADIADEVDVHLGLDTGPEALTGSTRLKAATAQKLVLNSLSTAVMVRCGRTYSNLMVDVVASNAKLRGRTLDILREASLDAPGGQLSEAECAALLVAAGGRLKTAVVMALSGAPVQDAEAALTASDDHVRAAVERLTAQPARR
ncbi:MAG: N-acetylmuramic acid 6-phosphate etherase [Pseudonocardiales bacterium]|nr:MAG: N-acetylmuramic acid 6-phosphate etherase [Pseudonocardiales bacterium]